MNDKLLWDLAQLFLYLCNTDDDWEGWGFLCADK